MADKVTTTKFGRKEVKWLVILAMAVLLFLSGWIKGNKQEETIFTFTYDEIVMIEKFQEQLTEELGSKAEVTVYKTKDGKLMLGWD